MRISRNFRQSSQRLDQYCRPRCARPPPPAGVRVLVYQDLAGLPPYNPDEDVEDADAGDGPGAARVVAACDAIVIAAPEYAHGVPGVLKNALDWLVASEAFAGKPDVLINASPSAYHAQANLREEILATIVAARLLADAFRRPAGPRQGQRYHGRIRPCAQARACPSKR